MSDNLSGFVRGTVTVREKELGTQANQEVGINFKILDKNGEVVVGHEGKVTGPTIAFIPGSLDKNYVDFTIKDGRDNAISGGAFCSTQNSKNCGVRLKGVLKFGGKQTM